MSNAYGPGQQTRLDKLSIPLRGPRLVDITLKLIEAHGLSGTDITRRYGLGPTWLNEQRKYPGRSPASDVIQMIYEDLTGRPLVKLQHPNTSV